MPTQHHIAPEIAHLAVPISSLRHYEGNPRQGDIGAISESLKHHNQFRPLVVNKRNNVVLAGNHTLAAMRALGWEHAAVTYVDVDDDQAARIVLVDNRTNDLSANDDQKLADLLQSLPTLEGTGYDGDALEALLADLDGQTTAGPSEGDPTGLDDVPDLPADPRTKPGDLLLLGRHRLLCGDCRDPAVLERLLEDQRLHVVVTSPPYAEQRTYDEGSGFAPIPSEEYVAWYEAIARSLALHLADDGNYFLNIKEHTTAGVRSLYVKDLVLAHVRAWGWRFVDELCWVKTGMPGDYVGRFKNAWEPIFHFTRTSGHKHFPDAVAHPSDSVPLYATNTNFELTHDGTRRGDEPEYVAGMARPSNVLTIKGGPDAGGAHPAAFPVALPTFLLRAYSEPGDACCDPFCGSGSVIVAAEHEDRVAMGIELSPAYVDVCCRRFQELTGIVPIVAATGEERSFL